MYSKIYWINDKTSKKKNKRPYVPKSVENFCCSDKKDGITAKVLIASRRLSIAEHLVYNQTCATVIIQIDLKTLKLVVFFLILLN